MKAVSKAWELTYLEKCFLKFCLEHLLPTIIVLIIIIIFIIGSPVCVLIYSILDQCTITTGKIKFRQGDIEELLAYFCHIYQKSIFLRNMH